jgi:hypothetical protein
MYLRWRIANADTPSNALGKYTVKSTYLGPVAVPGAFVDGQRI